MNGDSGRYSILSKLMKATGLAKKPSLPVGPRVKLMGMGGTFGRGEIRHCSTWNFSAGAEQSETLGRATSRAVRERRAETFRANMGLGKGIFNDLNNR